MNNNENDSTLSSSSSLSEVDYETTATSSCDMEIAAIDECVQTLQGIRLRKGTITLPPECLGDVPVELVFDLLVNSVDTAVDLARKNLECNQSQDSICDLTSHCTPCQVETMKYAQCSYKQRRRRLHPSSSSSSPQSSKQNKVRKRRLAECSFDITSCPHYIESIVPMDPSNSTTEFTDNITDPSMNQALPPIIERGGIVSDSTGASKSSGRKLLLATIIIAVIFLIDFILEKLQKYFHPTMANAAERRHAVLNEANDNGDSPNEVAIENSEDIPPSSNKPSKTAAEVAIEAVDGGESYNDNTNKRIIDMEQPIDRSSSRAEPSKPQSTIPPPPQLPPPFTESRDGETPTNPISRVITDVKPSLSTKMVDCDDMSDFESVDSDSENGNKMTEHETKAGPANGNSNHQNGGTMFLVDNIEMEQSFEKKQAPLI